ncbi:LacI family DNA-binding transcriptional regulator [Cetobacterium sp. ZWU0022]|uniref:LacI family DNA-binding transcriptional regulator n=1 Tax=Cetobacterium sp. ZWU0022 TaxID=1340502 RepID=UPI0006479B4F|nr:LacI family DNA-binding transcriptional regulator [Cetobacterium sp. ZWU0022]
MGKITLKDIAAKTGYSISTISRSLSDNNRIPLETREEIKKIAKELNYTIDINARNLSKKSSNTIGVFMQDDFFKIPHSTFTNVFWSTLHEEIQLKKYEPALYLFKNTEDFKYKVSQLFNSGIIDGIIIFSKMLTNSEIEFLKEMKYPYSLLYYGPEKYSEEVFTADNYSAGKIITQYLLNRNLKSILTITTDMTPSFKMRTLGFKHALEENGVTFNENSIIKSSPSFENGVAIAHELYGKLGTIDAIFAQHDIWALGLIKGFNDLGVKIPDEVSIIGHDNLSFKNWFSPELTSFTIETKKICFDAIESLIEDKIYQRKKIPTSKTLGTLILGKSVK